MFATYLLFFFISCLFFSSDAINPLKCNSDTVEPNCVVEESAVYSKWYAYDANGQECILIRWSDECDSPGNNVNIYASIKECQDECDRELKARRFG